MNNTEQIAKWEEELKETALIIKDWIVKVRDTKEQYFEIPHASFIKLFENIKAEALSSQRQQILDAVEKGKLIEASFPGSAYTLDWKKGYNKGIDDTLTTIKSL